MRVDRKNGIAQRVIIKVEGKLIIFISDKGKPRETGRINIGVKIMDEIEPHWISRTDYNKAVKVAGAILHQRARR